MKKIRNKSIADLGKKVDRARNWRELFEVLFPDPIRRNKILLKGCKKRDIGTGVSDADSESEDKGKTHERHRELIAEIVKEMKKRE